MSATAPASHRLIDLPSPFVRPLPSKLFGLAKPSLEKVLALSYLNRKYGEVLSGLDQTLGGRDRVDFLDRSLKALNISVVLDDAELERIPKEGAVVVVANHPFGALEGLVMAAVLRKRRPDLKIMANHLLERVEELRDLFLFVDPFEGGANTVHGNGAALKKILAWLREGGLLGVFPAGEVSHLQVRRRTMGDPPWNESVARIIRKTRATAVPMFFQGTNGPLFHMAGLIHPLLRTVLLPHALVRKAGSEVRVRIGRPLGPKHLANCPTDADLIGYLRHRTYLLQCGAKSRPKPARSFPPLSVLPSLPPLPLGPECPEGLSGAPRAVGNPLHLEQQALSADQTLLETDDFCVHLAEAHRIPHLLHEIGRLREMTFRLAGEGTGKEVDLDIFDAHYLHLFLWDKREQRIAGAYRLGRTDVILKNHGAKGLYTTTLFSFRPGFWDKVVPALELGRSFVRPEYQKNYAPLLLLWKGIARFILRHPQYRTLFGPVSIDNEYHRFSRQLMVGFLRANGHMHELADHVRPRRPFRQRRLFRLDDSLLTMMSKTIDDISDIITDIDRHKIGVPVLLRQYLKLGGKMLGFNVDREFSDVLDGLVLVDLLQTDRRTLDRYLGKEGARDFLAVHQAGEGEPKEEESGLSGGGLAAMAG
ncbi:lysophospholipid acyltransferase family protein [Desulfonatronum lacustre]|uniref:lysophospholipid acyltransferase family protein n=1 Tax=Desulfonatronum lacustre TaxID=66849 RepID=UPI0004B4EA50|nr:lysophospholipid acyltransferase family protein [Desulfonatronum lacustre]